MSTTVKSNLSDYNDTPCPRCGVSCNPVKKTKDGSIKFKKHYCDNGYELSPKFRDFKVSRSGEPIEPKE